MLRRLMDAVARAKTLTEVYEYALEILRSAALLERAAILVVDDGGVMRFVASKGLSDAYRHAVEGHSPWALGEPQPQTILVPNVLEDPHLAAFADLFTREGIGALAFVPLRFGTRLLGKFMLYLDEARAFYPQEIEAAESIALTLAYAIEHRRIEQQLEARLRMEQDQRRLAERESATRRRLEQRARAALAIAERAEGQMRLLAEASEHLASPLAPEMVLRELASFVVGRLADYAITYGFDGSLIQRLGFAHADPVQVPLVEALVQTRVPSLHDTYGAGAVIRTGESVLVADISVELLERSLVDSAHLDAVRRLDPRSTLIVPLQARGRTVGAMVLATTGPDAHRYGEQDLRLAEELAHRAALFVDNTRLYREAQQAAAVRQDMMAVVSHDLRGPLNTIVTSCAVLEHENLPPERRGACHATILRATHRMDRLLHDLLDVTRIDGGGVTFSFAPVDAESLVHDGVSLFRPQAEAKAIHLALAIEDDLPPIRADRDRVLQVLSNFLANAIEHAPAGGEIRVAAEPRAGGECVRFTVRDTGPGISPQQIKHVFDRYWRAHPRLGKGSGLGLAIAKGIVDRHAGQIGCESVEGRGSTFFFDLPAAKSGWTESPTAMRGHVINQERTA